LPGRTIEPLSSISVQAKYGILVNLNKSTSACDRYRSPGHHVDGGSLAEIFVVRSATSVLSLTFESQLVANMIHSRHGKRLDCT
jgi:hypothetical protein